MAGVDHSLAGIDVRQRFSFTKTKQLLLLEALKSSPHVLGAALLATCNRTEIYLSCQEGFFPDPFELLCQAANIDFASCRGLYHICRGDECFRHLCLFSCGALSQIWGEDQIISQVKSAALTAREQRTADGVLEVLFRTAVTAAKRIKTDVRFVRSGNSAATETLKALERQTPPPQKILVVGNGEMGRLTAETLLAQGFAVSMTLRQYKRGQIQVPAGAQAFDYSLRYQYMPAFDAVVSATSSPHYTIEAQPFHRLAKKPALLIDLASPRDIDPACAVPGQVALLDIDTLSQGAGDDIRQARTQALAQAETIVEKYRQDFLKWERFRRQAASN